MPELVETSVDEFHVALLRLNSPETRNALSAQMRTELNGELERLDADPEIRCMVIAGSEKVFAAGADIRAMAARAVDAPPDIEGADFWTRLAAIETPLVAAVSGYALGGGCELAMACDMIVADEGARFGQPEITLGIIPGGGGTQRLTRAIGKQRAMEYVLTGRRFDARTAAVWGLVNKATGRGAWLTEALGLARTVAERPPTRDPTREAGGPRRRAGNRRRAQGRAGACSTRRWRPRTGSRACAPSSRSASLTSRAAEGESMRAERKPASALTARRNREALATLPFADEDDFADATRGLLAAFEPATVPGPGEHLAWDLESYDFLSAEAPDTAHPSLWRQSQLNRIAGLFEIAPGFYQLRGFDLSNMHVVEGERGILVIDPLISAETAAAALAFYRQHRGERPVTGLLYTHSHIDHFGGAKGIVSAEEVAEREIPVLAPAGFLHHAISENVYAGTAMGRRAAYMYGARLRRGPDGQVGSGLGQTTSLGTVTLIPPNLDIIATGQEETVDGIRISFQLTPGTEAPSEMNFHFPDHRVLCVAENATHTMHNILTPRGALVRDAHVWSHYLNESIELFGEDSDVLFAGHHWPRWGSERIVDYLKKQRDLYAYLHDQTLRLINKGHTGREIAEQIELPPSLAAEWHCRGYYGSVSHNVKAIYQRYMGWFDGNPAHLWEHPPAESARRYVEFMGGAEAILEKTRASFEAGDYRWVVEVVNHVVFAEPDNQAARELQADALEQLGYGAENATWRNFFLMGAQELREGISGTPTSAAAPDILAQLSVEQILDAMAIRLDGPRAWDKRLIVNWKVTDPDERHLLELENGVLNHRADRHHPEAQATLIIERRALNEMLGGEAELAELAQSGRLRVEGDGEKLGELLGLLDDPDPGFAIVTPS